jgi:hemoglobin
VNAGLVDRLGGAAAVAAVVDDAVDRHAANPALAPLFRGKDLPQLKALGVSVFSARLGGPCSSAAAGLAPADAGMRFNAAERQAVVGDMTEALRERGIGTVEVAAIVDRLYAAQATETQHHHAEPPSIRHSARNDSRTRAA